MVMKEEFDSCSQVSNRTEIRGTAEGASFDPPTISAENDHERNRDMCVCKSSRYSQGFLASYGEGMKERQKSDSQAEKCANDCWILKQSRTSPSEGFEPRQIFHLHRSLYRVPGFELSTHRNNGGQEFTTLTPRLPRA
ncbi:hypothetical protein TNCV_5089791 [Trichonephila clavipes]|nr:hypothetical protein TNCV_5089791 [Trichonephila clavipes]